MRTTSFQQKNNKYSYPVNNNQRGLKPDDGSKQQREKTPNARIAPGKVPGDLMTGSEKYPELFEVDIKDLTVTCVNAHTGNKFMINSLRQSSEYNSQLFTVKISNVNLSELGVMPPSQESRAGMEATIAIPLPNVVSKLRVVLNDMVKICIDMDKSKAQPQYHKDGKLVAKYFTGKMTDLIKEACVKYKDNNHCKCYIERYPTWNDHEEYVFLPGAKERHILMAKKSYEIIQEVKRQTQSTDPLRPLFRETPGNSSTVSVLASLTAKINLQDVGVKNASGEVEFTSPETTVTIGKGGNVKKLSPSEYNGKMGASLVSLVVNIGRVYNGNRYPHTCHVRQMHIHKFVPRKAVSIVDLSSISTIANRFADEEEINEDEFDDCVPGEGENISSECDGDEGAGYDEEESDEPNANDSFEKSGNYVTNSTGHANSKYDELQSESGLFTDDETFARSKTFRNTQGGSSKNRYRERD